MGKISEFECLMDQVLAGSEEAVWELAETYTPYIIRSVRLSLSPKLRTKLDSQDIAQALWASLLLDNSGLSNVKSPGGLIAFLSRAARNKVVDQVRRHHAQKNDISREVRVDFSSGGDAKEATLYAQDPTPSQIFSVREHWDEIVARASERDQRILRSRIEGRSFKDISVEFQVSEMTARRAIESLIDQFCE